MSKFFKDKKNSRAVGQMQFAVFGKFTSALLHHIAREIIKLPVSNVHEKTSQSQDT